MANSIEDFMSELKDFDTSAHIPGLNRDFEYNVKALDIPRNYHMADYQYELIMEEIRDFEETLDEEHEVALKLSSFGQNITLSVTDIGYANPNTLYFHGRVGESAATLIQHVSQLNFLLLSVKKADPEKPPLRIGFASTTGD